MLTTEEYWKRACEQERRRSRLLTQRLQGELSLMTFYLEKAEKERDALREALTRIVTMTYHAAWAPATGERWLDHIDETARAALGEAGALR